MLSTETTLEYLSSLTYPRRLVFSEHTAPNLVGLGRYLVGGPSWRLRQSADTHGGRALLREVKGVVLTHRHFLAVASVAVRGSAYTCAKPPSTNNSAPET
jgi:hypothetical protein